MAVGVVMTTPLVLIEFCSFLYRPSLITLVARSKLKVKIRLWTMDENVDRKTERENSNLSHHILASFQHQCVRRGPTTVVFPCPMIICFTNDLPCLKLLINSFTNATCILRNTIDHVNSNTRKRGSYTIICLFHFRLRGHSPDFRHIGLWYYLHFGDEMALRG